MLTGANASSTIGSGSLVNAMPAKAKPAKSNVVRRLRCGINTARPDEPTAETAQRNLEKANKKSAQRHPVAGAAAFAPLEHGITPASVVDRLGKRG